MASNNNNVTVPRNKSYYQVVDNNVPTHTQAVAREALLVENDDHEDGIGIVNFLQGKNFFITGATGFLGKVLLEKLPRSTPDIGKIYLMIKARDSKAAAWRLKNEIIEAEVFKNLKQRLGKSYESFMSSKLIPVVGTVGESDLNLDEYVARIIARDVHVIINSAATSTFDERAQKYGWQDTYVFTKAMGEMMVNHLKGDIPVIVIRPSVIESTYRDPFPGWIEGNRMMEPVLIMCGKGLIPGFLGTPDCPLDVVPADTVVNAIIAAIAKHGTAQKPDINVYQVASSTVNPMHLHDMAYSAFEYFNYNPYIDSNGELVAVTPWKFFSSKEEFISCVAGCLGNGSSNVGFTSKDSIYGKFSEKKKQFLLGQIKYSAKIYEPYTSIQVGRFDSSNTQRLMEIMSEEEREMFGFEMKTIDWRDYLVNIHLPGVRRHVMKG